MPEIIDFSDPDDPFLQFIVVILRSYIEDGSIKVGERPPEEIVNEAKSLAREIADENVELRRVRDHRLTLLQRAEDEAAQGSIELAITLYALWIEHTVNGYLIFGLQHKEYSLDKVINPLIRDLSLRTKTTALWNVAGFEPLSDEDLALIDQISQARNVFVHYKWPAHDEPAHESMKEKLIVIVNRARNLEAEFNSRANKLLWNGREDEIMNFFWQDIRRRAEE
jgi:hypothetical protein